MEQEEILRQEAVRLRLQGVSIKSICEQINRSRQWVYKWLKKYEQSEESQWYKSSSNAPKKNAIKTEDSLEQAIIKICRRLSSQSYVQKGAIGILYEFGDWG
jgi:transposase